MRYPHYAYMRLTAASVGVFLRGMKYLAYMGASTLVVILYNMPMGVA